MDSIVKAMRVTFGSGFKTAVSLAAVTVSLSALLALGFAYLAVTEGGVVALVMIAPLALWMPGLWSIRLIRIILSGLATPRPATVQAMVSSGFNINTGRSDTFVCYLRIFDGEQRYGDRDDLEWAREERVFSQRVIYEPWFTTLGSMQRQVVLRRCPGLRAMYVVAIPGFGTLWPSAAAWKGRHGLVASLHEFPAHPLVATWWDRLSFGHVAAGGLITLMLALTPLMLVIYLVLWVACVWLWGGAAPPGSRWPGTGADPGWP